MKAALRLNDGDVRAALKRELLFRHASDSHTVIIEELGILHGSSRVDLAVVNGTLHGYELKSDRDDLQRLPEQVAAYITVFDLVTLVVGERHLRRALDLIPDWWGIKVARNESCGTVFCDLKLPTANPSPDPMSVVNSFGGMRLSLGHRNCRFSNRDLSGTAIRSMPNWYSIQISIVCGPEFAIISRLAPNWRAGGRQPSDGG